MDRMGNNAPDDKGVILGHADGTEIGIVRHEPRAAVGAVGTELLDGELAVDVRRHIIAVRRLQAAVDNHQIAVEDTRIAHAVALDARVERRIGMTSQLTGDIDAVGVVRRRRGKTCMQMLHQRQLRRGLVGNGNIF